MYTQCPECKVAFRVTAEVLKMAAGKVRCGGCGVAFNALEHLSETKPAPPPPPQEPADPDLPELRPEPPAELEADTPPKTISARQSAALLKTLDQLTGDDVRIEDTGVEWRVIDGDELEEEQDTAAADEPSRFIDEMRFDDNTVLPDDFDAVAQTPSPPQPETAPVPEPTPEPPQFNLDLSDPDEWDDLLGDLDEDEEPAAAGLPDEAAEQRPAADDPLDVDTQFELQAEALGIDISGVHEAQVDEDAFDETGPEPEATSIDEDLFAAAFEAEAAAREREYAAAGDDPDLGDFEIELDADADDEAEIEDDVEDIAQGFDDAVERDIETLSMSLDEDDDEESTVSTRAEDHVIPEMTEEEKTINMMIDQDLLNIAVEDENGFASTIVQLRPNAEPDEKTAASGDAAADNDARKPRSPLAVETIIMEGEFVRAELDREREGEDDTQTDVPGEPGVSLPINREKDDYARRSEMTSAPAGVGTYAAIAALVFLLGIQFIHQSRGALATVPAVNAAIAPVYRMLGQPLTPDWDIGGWRFEATKGDTDESGELLTVYSRIGNNSDGPLPYPLVHLSLTDRFEDVIGSVVLEPVDYLNENADPRKPVPPGSSFNAVISIEGPSPEATGFKLNVCYRLAAGKLRCADHDFK